MQALRDAMSQLKERNAVVFGVSADTVESHKQFHEKEKLNFSLLADPEAKMIEAYGALMPGRKMANRFTFVVGPDGKIIGIDRNVNQQFDRTGGAFTSEHGMKLALALTDWKAKLGQPVPYFSLPGLDGKTEGFSAGKKATVLVFLDSKDPLSLDYAERLSILAIEPNYVREGQKESDLAMVAIFSSRGDTPETVREFAQSKQLGFPVAMDPGGKVAARFDVRTVPTVWVLDAKGKAVYKGAIDDNRDGGKVNHRYLREAVDAVMAGKPVQVAETKAAGTPLKR